MANNDSLADTFTTVQNLSQGGLQHVTHDPTTNCTATLRGLTRGSTEKLDSVEDYELLLYLFWLQGVVLTTICIVGIIANLLNIAVLSIAVRKRNFVIHRLFLCMAVADLVTMVIYLSVGSMFGLQDRNAVNTYERTHPPNITVPYSRYAWYHSAPFFSNTTSSISNWMAVLMGLFRLIAASSPLKAPVLTSNTRVNISMSIVIVGLTLLNLPFWSVFDISDVGGIVRQMKHSYLATVSIFFCYFIPVAFCFVITVLLIMKLSYDRKTMKHTLGKYQADARQRENKQITVTLILISFFYIITNLPITVCQVICLNYWWEPLGVTVAQEWLFYLLVADIVLVGYACNFFIYIVGNAPFRQDLLEILRIRRPTYQPTNSERKFNRSAKAGSSSPSSSIKSAESTTTVTTIEDQFTTDNSNEQC